MDDNSLLSSSSGNIYSYFGHKRALNFGLRCGHKLDRCLLVKDLVHIAHTVLGHKCWMFYHDSLGSCELHQMLH